MLVPKSGFITASLIQALLHCSDRARASSSSVLGSGTSTEILRCCRPLFLISFLLRVCPARDAPLPCGGGGHVVWACLQRGARGHLVGRLGIPLAAPSALERAHLRNPEPHLPFISDRSHTLRASKSQPTTACTSSQMAISTRTKFRADDSRKRWVRMSNCREATRQGTDLPCPA